MMGFRRDGKKENLWHQRLEARLDLLQRARLPAFLFQDEATWWRFLLHGYHQDDAQSPPVDVIAMLADDERQALFELISEVYSDRERFSMFLWMALKKDQAPQEGQRTKTPSG